MDRKLIILLTLLVICGCSTRGLNDRYASITEQRLVTQSLDKLILALPNEDFEALRSHTVYLQSYFIEPLVAETGKQSSLLAFAEHRLQMELLEKYACQLSDSPENAAYQIHFFFNTIGTEQDSFGITSPQLFLPGVGVSQIDIIALEMFHGMSEGYYYIIDNRRTTVRRGPLQQARVRTDHLNLPFLSIPLNTLD